MSDLVPNDNVQARLLEMAFNAFNEHGYSKVSLDSLAKELKISKKTIYKHFSSKEQMLEAGIRENLNRIEASLKSLVKSKPGLEGLLKVAELYLEFTQLFSPRLGAEVRDSFPHMQEWMAIFEAEVFRKAFSKIAKEERSQGKIEYPLQTRELAAGFFALMKGLKDQSPELRTQMLQFFLKGLKARPAKKLKSKTKKKK